MAKRKRKSLGAVKHSSAKVRKAAHREWISTGSMNRQRKVNVTVEVERYRFGPGYHATACVRKPNRKYSDKGRCADNVGMRGTGDRSPTVAMKRALNALAKRLK